MQSSLFYLTPYDDTRHDDRVIFEDPARFAKQSSPKDPFLSVYKMIRDRYVVRNAVDLGCGLGVETVKLLQCGINTVGVDGSEALRPHILFPAERYLVADLRQNIRFTVEVDMVVCREVAEHIPFRYSELLVRNVVSNCRVCYFTAAPPGQIGSGHINCQYKPFWLSLFAKYEWKVDRDLTGHNERLHPDRLDRGNGFIVYGKKRKLKV